MNNKLRRNFGTILLIASMGAFSNFANETPGTELDPPAIKQWPLSPRPKSEVFHMEVSEDGPPQKRLVFDCGKFALVTGNYGDWKERNPNSRYSLQLSPGTDSDIVFAIARFPNNEFIESLNQSEWESYVESLKHHPSPRIIRHQRFSVERKAAPIVLNEKPYRIIEYEYTDLNGNTTSTRELFTFLDGELFVFALSGPSEKFELYQERVNLMISRMNVLM